VANLDVIYAAGALNIAKSPIWCSSARTIRIAANIRTVVAVGNVAQLAGCL
jgi:hypothetical protein